MITLKPHEILQKLGFNIDESGIKINENDSYLYDSTLGVLGATIDVDRISDTALKTQQKACSFLAGVDPVKVGHEFNDARYFLKGILKNNLKYEPRN